MKNTYSSRAGGGAAIAYIVLVLAILTGFNQKVLAAPSGGNGLRVSPVRTDLTIKPGESQTVSVSVTNITSAPTTLQTIVNDFTASPDESGDPALILAPGAYAASHSLKRFIGPLPNFSLPPGQQKTLAVNINVPKNVAAGGYYGAVRFAPATSGGANKTVSLASSVGSLILIKVPGNIQDQLSIASFDARQRDRPSSFFMNSKDIMATLRLQNEGNVQEAPFGKILLKDHSGKLLYQTEFNNSYPPSNILPNSIRKFSIPLNKLGGFGKYKVQANLGYGTNGQLLTANTSFYIVPKLLIIIFISIVALVVFLVFGLPRLIRAYNRRILSRAGRVMGKSSRH